jgi:hypothetical protein
MRNQLFIIMILFLCFSSAFSFLTFAKPYFLKEGFKATYVIEPAWVLTELVADGESVGGDGGMGDGKGTYSWQVTSLSGSDARVNTRLDVPVKVLNAERKFVSTVWNISGHMTVDVDSREVTALNNTDMGTINYWINPSVQKGDAVVVYGKPPYQLNATITNYHYNPLNTAAGQFDCWLVYINNRIDVPMVGDVFLWYDKATGMLVAAKGGYFDVALMLMGISTVWTMEDDFLAPAKFVLQSMGVVSVPHLLGDINDDGRINIVDMTLVAKAFDSSTGDPRYKAECDLNSDGRVNIIDITAAATQFGKTS